MSVAMRRRGARRRGASLTEAGLMLTFVLMLLFGIVEYGRLIMVRQVTESAARDGARYAVVHTYDKVEADIQNQVDGFLSPVSSQFIGYDKTTSIHAYRCDPGTWAKSGSDSLWSDAKFGEPILVQVTGTYQPIFPLYLFGGNSSFTMTIGSVMYSEAN